MSRLNVLAIVGLVVSLVCFAGPQVTVSAAEPCTVTLNAGDSIQDAIDAASSGDVICLNPGTYLPGATINVTKSVTIQGPQAGVDPRLSAGTARTPGDAATEAIVSGAGTLGYIFVFQADEVTIDGLEVTNGTGDLITSSSSTTQARPAVRYNIVHHSTGDEGIQLKKVADAIIEYNHVYDTVGDGINIGYTSTGGAIRSNEVHDIHSPDGGMYVYETPDVTIQCNLVYDVYNNDGIKLGSKNGGDAGISGGSILHNTVYNTAQDGIAVYTSDTVVEGNKVYNSSSENGAIYVAHEVSNITISLNDIHANSLNTGKWGDPGAIMIGTGVDAATVHVNRNNVYGNTPNGLTNKAAAELDAQNNWWGAVDGPGGAGLGSGDAVSANIDFEPWLAEPQDIPNPCVTDDQGPATTGVLADPNPVAVGAWVVATANVDDTDTGGSDIQSAEYSLNGGTWTVMSAQDGAFDAVSEGVGAGLAAPAAAGLYDLCVRGTDAANNTGPGTCIMLVVYDPDGGFVTGGGWIASPAGASPSGKATFGFVAKYKKGATVPDGNTEFVFPAGNLNFHSTSYDWLVVTGSNYARFKGQGTVNGGLAPNDEPFKFMIWARDGEPDTFRIKIWWEESEAEHMIYDNGMDQAIGGSIVVHAKKK